MKRLLGLLIVLGLVAIPFSHAIGAKPKGAGQEKVFICHVTDEVVTVTTRECFGKDEEGVYTGHVEFTTGAGQVISVAAPAVDAHFDHGCCGPDLDLIFKGARCKCSIGVCVRNE